MKVLSRTDDIGCHPNVYATDHCESRLFIQRFVNLVLSATVCSVRGGRK